MGYYIKDKNILVFSFLCRSYFKHKQRIIGTEETIYFSSVLSKVDSIQREFKELFVGSNESLIKKKKSKNSAQ